MSKFYSKQINNPQSGSFTGSFTGSLLGTASYAISASYATTSSYVLSIVTSASYAQTASFVILAQTASYVVTAQTASFYGGSVVSASHANNADLANTASYIITAQTASYITSSKVYGPNGSNSILTASYATTASFALNGGGGNAFPYTGSAIITGSLIVTGSVFLTGPTLSFADGANLVFGDFTGSQIGNEASMLSFYGRQPLSQQGGDIASVLTNLGLISSGYVSLARTASYVVLAQTASYYGGSVVSASHTVNADTASLASTASYIITAQTASYYQEIDPIYISKSGSYATTGSNIFKDSQTIQGDLNIFGTLTAQVYVISSSVIHFTESFSSGSTIFGDDTSDTHQFTGSVFISGSALKINGLNVLTDAITASYVLNSQTSSMSVLNAQTASYVLLAKSASFVTLAQTASYITISQTASYVLQAVSASNASTALTANTASYVITAQTASYYGGSVVSASHAETSSLSITANTASYVITAQTASYVLQAVSASLATLALTANTASYVITAQTASYIITAQTASYITASNVYGPFGSNSITSASYAATASLLLGLVVSASYANTASYALSGGPGYFIDQTPSNGTYGTLTGSVNSSNTGFTSSQGKYSTGTLVVYLNGQLQTQGSSNDYQEVIPGAGTFAFNTAPANGEIITAQYQIAQSANTAGFTWTLVTNSVTMSVNTGYIANSGSLLILTLPLVASVGQVVEISGMGTGGWKIAQNASGIIHFVTSNTTTGVAGSLASTNTRDAVKLICIIANNEWNVISSIGNLTVI